MQDGEKCRDFSFKLYLIDYIVHNDKLLPSVKNPAVIRKLVFEYVVSIGRYSEVISLVRKQLTVNFRNVVHVKTLKEVLYFIQKQTLTSFTTFLRCSVIQI